MRKVFFTLLALALLVPALALADLWHPANQSTLAWEMDLNVTRADGSTFTIPAEEIHYKVFRLREGGNKETEAEFLGETQEMQYKVAFSEEGAYRLGVQAVRRVPGIEKEQPGPFGWSDDPACTNATPFGVTFVIPPAAPKGIAVE
jgi:hypothetical protein